MAYFENEKQMYIPLSVDEIDVSKQGYFLSNKKVVEMVIAFIPYMIFMYFMLQIGSRVLPIVIFTAIYIFLFTFFFRFRILEENRLKKMLYELDNNRYSGADHFWGINKIGNSEESNGLIYYEKNSHKNIRGFVVKYDRGSTVGVPQGNYTNYRKSKQDFLRSLGDRGYDFMWYEIPERKETPQSMIYYFNVMANMKNKTHQKLLKLQIDMNTWFVKDSPEKYVDYILIKCNRVSELQGFRNNLEDIISTTLDNNNYIVNPRILGKKDVENFISDLFLIKSLDSSHIYKGQNNIAFEKFGTITRILGQDNREVDIDELNLYQFTDIDGKTLEDIVEKDNNIIARKLKALEYEKDRELKALRTKRLKDRISEHDYNLEREAIIDKFEQREEDIKTGKDLLEKDRKLMEMKQEKEAKLLAEKERKLQLERDKSAPRFVTIEEDVEIITTEKVIDNLVNQKNKDYEKEHEEDYLYEDELSLEDLLDDEEIDLDSLRDNFNDLLDVDEGYINSLEDDVKYNKTTEFEGIEEEEISLEDLLKDE